MKVKDKPRRTQAERRAATRAAFLDAAWKVFLRKGYAGSSAEEISAEAGFTRGAFHYNFGSRAELFAELLQERVYDSYRRMAEAGLASGTPSPRKTGEMLAALQAGPDDEGLFGLWLELLAESGRDENLRELAAGFWRGNRELLTELIRRDFEASGTEPPVAPEVLASGVIALDIGLAVQHKVDPDTVPLSVYPDLFEALFEPLRSPAG
jgi:AcrR family transcriptional regulator